MSLHEYDVHLVSCVRGVMIGDDDEKKGKNEEEWGELEVGGSMVYI